MSWDEDDEPVSWNVKRFFFELCIKTWEVSKKNRLRCENGGNSSCSTLFLEKWWRVFSQSMVGSGIQKLIWMRKVSPKYLPSPETKKKPLFFFGNAWQTTCFSAALPVEKGWFLNDKGWPPPARLHELMWLSPRFQQIECISWKSSGWFRGISYWNSPLLLWVPFVRFKNIRWAIFPMLPWSSPRRQPRQGRISKWLISRVPTTIDPHKSRFTTKMSSGLSKWRVVQSIGNCPH